MLFTPYDQDAPAENYSTHTYVDEDFLAEYEAELALECENPWF